MHWDRALLQSAQCGWRAGLRGYNVLPLACRALRTLTQAVLSVKGPRQPSWQQTSRIPSDYRNIWTNLNINLRPRHNHFSPLKWRGRNQTALKNVPGLKQKSRDVTLLFSVFISSALFFSCFVCKETSMLSVLSLFISWLPQFYHDRCLSPAQGCDRMSFVASHPAYTTEQPTEFRLCLHTLISFCLLLFLYDLGCLRDGLGKWRGSKRENGQEYEGILGALKWPLSLIVRPFMNDWFTLEGMASGLGLTCILFWECKPPHLQPLHVNLNKSMTRRTLVGG